MRTDARWLLLGLLLVFPAGVARSQEEPEKESPPPPPPVEQPTEQSTSEKPSRLQGKLFVQADFWYVQPAGLDYLAASVIDTTVTPPLPGIPGSLSTSVLDVGYSATWRPRYQLAYSLDNDAGTFSGSYFAESQQFGLIRSDPGHFQYGEIQAFPLYAGAFDDGTADAFEAHTTTKHREWRLDFSRRAFDTPRVKGRWLVGWREVNHTGVLKVDYKALNPGPPFPPPLSRPDLIPNDDRTVSASGYSGRGPEAGLEVQFPFGKAERFSIDSGLTFALLRGDLRSSYSSFTWLYVNVFDEDGNFLRIDQISLPIGVQEATVSTNGTAVDTHLGFRWRTWKGLEVTGGFRSSYHAHVGTYIQPAGAVIYPGGGYNVQGISHKDLNVVYEGLYMGIAYTF